MILTPDQIKEVIVNPGWRNQLAKARAYNTKMRLHIYGTGLAASVRKIDGYEPEDMKKLRTIYARSNKDLMARLKRPTDKVFSARGGSVYLNLPDSKDRAARSLALNVHGGMSIHKWIENIWHPHMADDPEGIILLEILPAKEAILAKQQGKSFVYPTYKAVTAIHNYLPCGSRLEYLVMQVGKADLRMAGLKDDEQVYRVIDDAQDYWVKRTGDEVQILTAHSLPNYFGYVPAMLNSDIISTEDDTSRLSFFDDAIELADHFFLKGSIKLTHEFLHGFPKYWEYADSCDKCGGTKLVDGEECRDCHGTGKRIMSRVSDAKLLEMPDADNPAIAPDVAGYVSPDKTYYEIATADLALLEQIMHLTVWGAQSPLQTQGMQISQQGETKTATQIVSDMKPQGDRLRVISEMAERRHKFILDGIIKLQVAMNYGGSNVNYGRRYMIEDPDAVWDKYSNARAKGAALSVLDDLLSEYYEAKYQADPIKLATQIKLMKVEPFVHFKISEVLGFNLSEDEYKRKLYFGEWLSGISEGEVLGSTAQELRLSLDQYAGLKKLLPPPQPQLNAA